MRSRSIAAYAGAVTIVVTMVACSSDGPSANTDNSPAAATPTAAGSDTVATVRVGVIPIVDVAPLYVGIKEGFFKKEHLEVKPQLQGGGAIITSSVLSGSLDLGFSNNTSLVIAASKDLPVKIISAGVNADKKITQSYSAVMVKKNSPIKTAKDLDGKTISVNGLNNVGPLTINTAMGKTGADYTSVKYTEVQFPHANAALQQGRVDAAFVVEPFVTQGLSQGERIILNPFEQTSPSYAVSSYFTSAKYAAAHPQVIAHFVAAINRSLTYSQRHPKVVRQVLPTYTKVPAALAQKIRLPQWTPKLDASMIKPTSRLASKYGYIKTQPSMSTLIRPESN